MGAKPKLTPEQWVEVKAVWESDPREGFTWIVKEMSLPVSRVAVRKVALNEKWAKKQQKNEPDKPPKKDQKSKVPKVSRKTETKVSETITETIEETLDDDGESKKGRPTEYREEFADQAYRLCLLGATDAEMAEFFDVSEVTINAWKSKHPDFLKSIRRGKMESDARLTERLYVRACGYRYTEVKVRSAYGENGEKVPVEEIETEKEVPPDGPSAFRWLYNRRPQNWRERNESSLEIKFDKETLDEIKQTFISRMEASRARQRAVLIERGILIEHSED